MNKIILGIALSSLLVACGGESEKEAVEKTNKESVKAVAASTETAPENARPSANAAGSTITKGFDKKAEIEQAKKITKAFTGELKAELKKAMKEGGPLNALKICNTEAMQITKRVAKEHGATLSRVSLKNRNPDNVPNDWQKAVLQDFDTRTANGEDIKTMAFADIIENEGKKQFRFMKALPTGGKCLECHGSEIDADVNAKLAELYPEDKATGYEKGQVRGAVVIVKELN